MKPTPSRRAFLGAAGQGLALACLGARARAAAKPNVLFIALDDLNDWIQVLDPDAPIQTPNLERLAARGTLFTHAYCAAPACNPSRTSLLTGLRPVTTGVYGNKSDWRQAVPDVVTLPHYFRNHGYRVEGAGKIFHHHYGSAFHDDAAFDDFLKMPDPPDTPMPEPKLNRLADYGSPNTDWGVWPPAPDDSLDVHTANYVTAALQRPRTEPFFLAAGIFRPHMPFFAPESFYARYPLDTLRMPDTPADDLDDLPPGADTLLKPSKWFFREMMEIEQNTPGTWRDAVRAYQASATFADAQVGRILDALDASPQKENTIVVLWSDNGYHLGEKAHWEKFALWEKTTHIPLIIVAPGVTPAGTRCVRTVSLLDLYPTLLALCGLPPKEGLEGQSLVPLLEEPGRPWERPAVMTYLPGNHAVRDERWRYIRYADGSEELYDDDADPGEFTNLAGRSEYAAIIERLAAWLPEKEAPPAPDMPKPK